MDHVLPIKKQKKCNDEDNAIVTSNSSGEIENTSTNCSYHNKLAAHKPYDFFSGNSRKYTDTVLINSFIKEKTFAFSSKESNCSSSNAFMGKIKDTIHTNKSISDVMVSSNSFEEPWVIQSIDLPTYKSLLICALKDQPPGYQDGTGKISNKNEVSRKFFQLEFI